MRSFMTTAMITAMITLTGATLFTSPARAEATGAIVDVVLSPMGDFKAKTADIKGSVVQKGDEFIAENIVVNLTNLKTGVELRDKHVKKYLQTDKFPEAVLLSATGKGGNGTGKIKIKGIEKDIKGTYTTDANSLTANFSLILSDFDIKDITYMGVGVEDEVKLHVTVPLTKAAAAAAPAKAKAKK